MIKTAVLSNCGTYRYVLMRIWDREKPLVNFVGLNPSVADHEIDDHTVRKWIGFATRWGFGGFTATNLWPYRSTDPKRLKTWLKEIDREALLTVNKDNMAHIYEEAARSKLVVPCWGSNAENYAWAGFVLRKLPSPMCLGITKNGHPGHVLMLSYDVPLLTIDAAMSRRI